MGFLSKLFGGDAGPAPSKPQDEAAGSSAAAAAAPQASLSEAPAAATTVPRPPEPAADAAAAPRAPAPEPLPPPVRAEIGLTAPKSASTSALRAPIGDAPAPARRADGPDTPRDMARPTSKNIERQPAVAAATTAEPAAAAPAAPRRPPLEAPRRSAQLESSIITSAPDFGADPSRVAAAANAAAPRPAAATRPARPPAADPPRPPAAPEPNPPPRAPMASVSGEPGLLGSRTRKDRTKSPGFYSNMAPAYGSQTVTSGVGQASLKRTAVGVAPPPEPPAVAGGEAAGKAPAEAAPAATASPRLPGLNGADTAALLSAAAPLVAPAANDVGTVVDVAPAQEAADEELEKEETAPGVGHTPSRHDPALRNEIAERDLELLVQFGIDLGLGIVSEAWLTVAREAVIRIKLTAIRLSRSPLDKALAQLGAELDGASTLSEERRSRIIQHLTLVDLALPRPIDVAGQRLLREGLIVQHLLAELSTTQPLVAQRLREEGSISLERVPRLVPAELASRVGLEPQQVEQALGAFRDYLDERARRGPEAAQIGKGRLLAQRLADLEASADHFERVADSDDAQAKREARRRRQSDIARVSLFLAEWGEAALLGEFERSSVQGKIARLRRWLTELAAS